MSRCECLCRCRCKVQPILPLFAEKEGNHISLPIFARTTITEFLSGARHCQRVRLAVLSIPLEAARMFLN